MKSARKLLYLCLFLTFSTVTQAQDKISSQIQNIVLQMKQAIQARDERAYSRLVDWSDPVFALEHRRWMQDWIENGASVQELSASSVTLSDVDTARATLVLRWSGPSGLQRAEWEAVFRKFDERWSYAGERWIDLRTPQALVRVAPGLESQGQQIAEALPGVLEHVQTSFGRRFETPIQVKLYASSQTVTSSVSLNAPLFGGWNEPGEALKIVARRNGIPLATLAHEATHQMVSEVDENETVPWWLHEGLADYVASKYWENSSSERVLERVKAWARAGQLVDWGRMAVYKTTPLELWDYVYAQGYAMTRYVTETYGAAKRNAWLENIAAFKNVSKAATNVFDKDFLTIDAEFQSWLLRP
jgi:Protein of unknown function (DUF1570)